MRITDAVFGITAAVICGSTLLTYTAGQRVIELQRAAEKRERAIVAFDDLFSTVQDAETCQRGFVITGDDGSLKALNYAQARLSQNVESFREFTDIGVSEEESSILAAAVRHKLAELRHTIDVYQSGQVEAARAKIGSEVGKAAIEEIRSVVGRIRSEQETQLAAERRRSGEATGERTATFFTAAALSLLVLLWGYTRIRRGINERDAAVAAERRQHELLSTTLASIADCVVVTDVEGRVTFMNPIADRVTGWSEQEAKGRLLKDVFRLIAEESRQPVEDPFEKVIRSGPLVGLTNGTLLIRKDGSEVPIDHTGAAVRTRDGKIEGVVLVFRDFSSAKQAERELKAAKEAAESANRAKDNFLAMLSHELRTPLTPVLATLQVWEMRSDFPPELDKDVYMLRRNIELEARLINDLLDLTRISRGVLSFHKEVVDVHRIIDLLISMSRSDAQGKQLNMQVNLDAERHFVRTDASRLQQVLWNILRNAVNFSEPNGTVLVGTNDEGERLKISISDTGVGMSPQTLERIFTPFEQGDRARSVRYGGLGLGLAISRALVQQMDGEIEATSAGLGRGSKFTLRFEALDETAVRNATPRQTVETLPETRRILLVEDHVDSARALAHLLKSRGHHVITAGTMREAESTLETGNFDLLICDIGLPDGTGYDLVMSLRTRSDIVAIALTGFGMRADVDRAIAAGFNAHLTKPVDLQKLEAAIKGSQNRSARSDTPQPSIA